MAQSPDAEEVVLSTQADPNAAALETGAEVEGSDGSGDAQTAGSETLPTGGTPAKGKEKQAPVEAQMLDAIKAAIKPGDTEAAKKAATDEAAKKAALAAGKTEQQITEEKTNTEAAEKAKADAAATAALKGKKADDFMLKPEELKVLHAKTQERMHTLHRYAKDQEAVVAQQGETIKAMSAARDEILATFKEYRAEPDDLIPLLEVNLLVKTGRYEEALKWVDTQRAGILKELGREAPGVDLLAEFPDLKQKAEDEQITRADAVELANARRREKASSEAAARARDERGKFTAVEEAQNTALISIERWCAGKSKGDIDYKKKEEKILTKLDAIIKKYPPQLWLPTLEQIYDSIEVVKEAAPINSGAQPLRPGGPKPGARQATNMEDAIRQGLGYPSSVT